MSSNLGREGAQVTGNLLDTSAETSPETSLEQSVGDGMNDAGTEMVLRAMDRDRLLGRGSHPWLSEMSGVPLSTVHKALSGQARCPAPLLRALFLLVRPERMASYVSLWTGRLVAFVPPGEETRSLFEVRL